MSGNAEVRSALGVCIIEQCPRGYRAVALPSGSRRISHPQRQPFSGNQLRLVWNGRFAGSRLPGCNEVKLTC